MRIDKFLWAIRHYKTRTLATHACDQGKILMLDHTVKPSRIVKPGDEFKIKRPGITRTYKITQLTENRIAAKLVVDFIIELTPQSEIDDFKARSTRGSNYRDPGTGRPTKRDRRTLDDFFNTIEE